MFKSYLERIREAGVVGAGGAGFPTHIKVNNEAEIVIANGAECEPLLRVDQQIMDVYAEQIVKGLKVVMKTTNAKKGVICLKEKYYSAVHRLRDKIEAFSGKKDITLFLIDNFYPAGDEQQMVYEVTGKVVPLGGLPMDVGAVVTNVTTLLNIACAVECIPVTNKFVTVTGAVNNPVTLNVPIGTPIKKIIEIAGGPTNEDGYTLILGGPLMGSVEENWQTPVTKTLGGVIILPNHHMLVKKKTASLEQNYKLAKSVCCQCNYCTQLCPRNALGLGVEPHRVMRTITYGRGSTLGDPNTVFGCSQCGLCTYYACNMGLNPSKMVNVIKQGLSSKGIRPEKKIVSEVSQSIKFKKVPTKRLIQRLDLGQYDVKAQLEPEVIAVDTVKIPLKQHIGVLCDPIVKQGDQVNVGDMIGHVEEGKLGATIHASISGKVMSICDNYIEISSKERGI